MMPGKSAIGSVTIISALVVLLAQLAQAAGYALSADDQAALTNLIGSGLTVVTTLVSMAGAAGAIWGRIRAQRPITSVLPK